MTLGKPLDLGPELLVRTVKVTLPTSQGSGGSDREVMKTLSVQETARSLGGCQAGVG